MDCQVYFFCGIRKKLFIFGLLAVSGTFELYATKRTSEKISNSVRAGFSDNQSFERLRNFALWFSRVGKINLAGLCVMTLQKNSRLDFFPKMFGRSLTVHTVGAFSHFFCVFRQT